MTSPTTRDDWLRLPNAAAATEGSFIKRVR